MAEPNLEPAIGQNNTDKEQGINRPSADEGRHNLPAQPREHPQVLTQDTQAQAAADEQRAQQILTTLNNPEQSRAATSEKKGDADEEKKEKQRTWEDTRKEIDTWVDALGEGLDEGVKDTVTACKALELHTGQSCEGHTDHGIAAPWIRFEAPNEPEYRYVGEQDVWIRVAKKYRMSPEKARRGYNKQAWQEGVREIADNDETLQYKRWSKETAELKKRVASLLTEFYQEKETDVDLQLRIADMGGSFTVGNGGEDAQPAQERNLSEEEKRALEKRLESYQLEMAAFGEFLRQKFFEQN